MGPKYQSSWNFDIRTIFDPETGEESLKGYKQIKTSLEMVHDSGVIMDLYGLDRSYLTDQDYKKIFGFDIEYELSRRLTFNSQFQIIERLRYDNAQGEGSVGHFQLKLNGYTNNKIRMENVLDYRHGNYDIDLTLDTEDRILKDQYDYLGFIHYLEGSSIINTSLFPIRINYAGEVRKSITNLASDLQGISIIGYLRNQVRLSKALTLTFT